MTIGHDRSAMSLLINKKQTRKLQTNYELYIYTHSKTNVYVFSCTNFQFLHVLYNRSREVPVIGLFEGNQCSLTSSLDVLEESEGDNISQTFERNLKTNI